MENPTYVLYMGNIPHTIAFESSLMDLKGKKNENKIFAHDYFGVRDASDGLWRPVTSSEYSRR
jgi:hypothetical protein